MPVAAMGRQWPNHATCATSLLSHVGARENLELKMIRCLRPAAKVKSRCKRDRLAYFGGHRALPSFLPPVLGPINYRSHLGWPPTSARRDPHRPPWSVCVGPVGPCQVNKSATKIPARLHLARDRTDNQPSPEFLNLRPARTSNLNPSGPPPLEAGTPTIAPPIAHNVFRQASPLCLPVRRR